MYEIIIDDKALKKISKFSKDIQQRIFRALDRIRIRPEAHVTKLVGEHGYKLRVGDYRIILDMEKKKLLILVITVGHRKNIYKNL